MKKFISIAILSGISSLATSQAQAGIARFTAKHVIYQPVKYVVYKPAKAIGKVAWKVLY